MCIRDRSSQRARDRVSRFGLDLDLRTALKFEGCFLDLALGGSLQPELASNPARFGPEVRKYARLGEAEGLAHVGA